MTLSTALKARENSQPTGLANDSTAAPLTIGTPATQATTDPTSNHRTAAEPRALTVIKWSSWIVFVAIFTMVGITTANQMFGQIEPSAPGYVLLVDRVMLIAGGLLGALFGTLGSYLFSLTMARMLGYEPSSTELRGD